jgi:hypothetical protein
MPTIGVLEHESLLEDVTPVCVIEEQPRLRDQQLGMYGTRAVHFVMKNGDGIVELNFPEGTCMEVPMEHVARSGPLQDMLDRATASGDTTLTLPSAVECGHLQHWCWAVLVGAEELPPDAGHFVQCLEVRVYSA